MRVSQKCCGELVELTVGDIWQIADAGDQELQRLAHSSRRGSMELGAEDSDGLPGKVLHSLRNRSNQPVQVVIASAETDHARISGSLLPDLLQHFEHAATCPWPSLARKKVTMIVEARYHKGTN